jgi:tetratricopeptide (TPR) repeat protein
MSTPAPRSVANLERLIARGEASAAQFYELGGLKLESGDAAGAARAYRRCVELEPLHAGAHNNLGSALLKSGEPAAAIEALQTALRLEPGYLRALTNLGKAFREAGRPLDAVAVLEQALAQDPRYVPALVNMADARVAAGDAPAGERLLERCIELAPRLIEARTSLGVCQLALGRMSAAIATLQNAVAIDPDHIEARLNLAHALFAGGDWGAAWPHFEHRLRRDAPEVPAGSSRWDGRPEPGLELWLLGEQGLGDQIQFARYARLFAEKGITCRLACHPRLVELLARADLGGARVQALGASPAGPHVRWLPLMSAPYWHGTTPDSVPGSAAYLRAQEERVAYWRSRLPQGSKPRIGLVWAGNPRVERGRFAGRSPPLAALAPLLGIDATFVSLQLGGDEALEHADFARKVVRLPGLDEGPSAFLDSAAVLKCLDLLVTSDTAAAHVSGGLGVPTWLCLKDDPDWRWTISGSRTPWYASMRLFRQPRGGARDGDWAAVYRDVASAIGRHLHEQRAWICHEELP